MKIVCISDLHNLYKHIDVPAGDMLIIAGDVSNTGKPEELIAFNAWLGTLPHKYKVMVAGNHDMWFERFPELARDLIPNVTHYLENSDVEIEGIKIWGSPVTPQFYYWAFMYDRDKLDRLWQTIPACDILITHGPPAGILDRTIEGDHAGCKSLFRHVKRVAPKYHIFGHIHEGRGVHIEDGTIFLNVSTCNRRYEPVNPPLCFDFVKESQ